MNLSASQPVRALAPSYPAIIDYGEARSGAAQGRMLTLAQLLRRHRKPIAGVFVLAMFAGGVVGALQTPLYRAKVLLAVEGRNPDFLNNKALDANGTSRSADSFLATQTKLLRSETLATRVVQRMDLADNAAFFRQNPTTSRFRSWLGMAPRPLPVASSQAVQTLLSRITVKPEGDSDLLAVTVDTPDPILSADIANTLSSEFIAAGQEDRWNSAVRVDKWLNSQLEEFRVRLQRSEDELQKYAQGANLLFINDDRTNVADEKLRQIQQDLSRAQSDRAEKQAQIELVTSAPTNSLPRVLDDVPMRDLTIRIADLRAQEADLSATLTPSHYKVQRVRAQIAELTGELNTRKEAVLARIRNEYDAAARRERLLQAAYSTQARTVVDQNSRASRYNVLKRDVETNRALYSSMLQRVKEAGVLSALRTDAVRVVDRAQVPEARYRPNHAQNFGLAFVAFLMSATVIVLARERADRSIRDPGEVLHLCPELGAIPSARQDPQVRALFEGRGPRKAVLSGVTETPTPESALDLRLVTWTYSRSLIADAFRSVALALVRFARQSHASKVFVFTSPHNQAGKSTTAANVAIAVADGRRRVLLIDGDLRRPQLDVLFGIALEPGLIDILAGTDRVRQTDLSDLVKPTAVAGLSVLTAGRAGNLDPMILGSERFGELIARLRLEFDMILVDTPPVMYLPDARLLSRHSDGVVMVVRAGKTSVDQMAEVARTLADDGVTILGVVLNDWNPKVQNPSYYGAYYSSYSIL